MSVRTSQQARIEATATKTRLAKAEQIMVVLPCVGRNERAFAREVGAIIGPLNVAFLHNDRVVEIYEEPVSLESEDTLDRNKLARGGLKFRPLTGVRIKSWIEQFLTPGIMIKMLDDHGNPIRDANGKIQWKFAEKTMGEALGRSLVENPFLRKQLPRICRILPVPIPILTSKGDIRLPTPGYNKDLQIYCAASAPPIRPLLSKRPSRS